MYPIFVAHLLYVTEMAITIEVARSEDIYTLSFEVEQN